MADSAHYIGRSPAYGLFETQTLTPNSSTVTFALNYQVGGASSLLVNYGGVIQIPNLAYNVTNNGANITFSDAPATGTTLSITYMGKQLLVPRVASQYLIISSNGGVTAGNYYMVDTAAAALTVTLPAMAALGDTIRFIDLSGTFDINNLTIDRNAHKIQRVADNLVVNTEGSAFDLIYSNSTNGWLVVPL